MLTFKESEHIGGYSYLKINKYNRLLVRFTALSAVCARLIFACLNT